MPRHWCHKRKYLQGKRGLEKAPFALPAFIATTGIEKIRTTILEAEAAQSAKQKGRGRVAPKMGKIDIDYQVGLAFGHSQSLDRSCNKPNLVTR